MFIAEKGIEGIGREYVDLNAGEPSARTSRGCIPNRT